MTNLTVNTLQSQIVSVEAKLNALRLQVSDLEKQQSQIELDPDNYKDQFDDGLDESIPEIKIGRLTYLPSHVLKAVDPTAYRCSLIDFVDSLDVEDSDEYKSLQEEIDDIQDEIEQLQSDIEDLESEIEDLNE